MKSWQTTSRWPARTIAGLLLALAAWGLHPFRASGTGGDPVHSQGARVDPGDGALPQGVLPQGVLPQGAGLCAWQEASGGGPGDRPRPSAPWPEPTAGILVSAISVESASRPDKPRDPGVQLCQFSGPQPRALQGVDGQSWRTAHHEAGWRSARPLPWESFGQGEFIGPPRLPHVLEYRLRVDDSIDFVYRFTHEEIKEPYRLVVGDELMVETFPPDDPQAIRRGDLTVGRGLTVQPDGTIVLPGIGSVPVVDRTIDQVKKDLEVRYGRLLVDPEITITPLKTNTRLEDLRSAVDARFGTGGQTRTAVVAPDGTVQLVGLASVPAQGLTLDELQSEINARYVELVGRGVEVTAALRQYAPRFVWVVGEVRQPGQYTMNQPITVIQALALAQGFSIGGNVREIIVFRRDDNWQLMATRLDVRGVFVGATPQPSDNIWLRDNDVVVVPKMPILRLDEFIELVFTRGIYGVIPFNGVNINLAKLSTL